MTPPITPIGDMGVADLTEATLTNQVWETAGDWDTEVDAEGVVHENVTDSDNTDATTLKLGVDLTNPPVQSGLQFLYALHEDSGATVATDFSGNNNDGSINGAPEAQDTFLGTDAYDFETESVSTGVTTSAGTGDFAFAAWVNPDNINPSKESTMAASYNGDSESTGIIIAFEGDGYRFWMNNDDFKVQPDSSGELAENQWVFVFAKREGGTAEIFTNLVSEGTFSTTSNVSTSGDDIYLGYRSGESQNPYDGSMWAAHYWEGAVPSVSDMQDLYSAGTSGFLRTGTKSFTSTTTPDLEGLVYSQSAADHDITIDVIGSPGTAGEETQSSPVLSGETSVDLTWSDSHQDFRIQVNLTTDQADTTPTVGKVELTPP